jgi:hypothetical protein
MTRDQPLDEKLSQILEPKQIIAIAAASAIM